MAEIFRALPGCTNPLCPGISSPSPKHGMTKVPSPLGDTGDEVYLGELQSPMHRGETFQKRFKKKQAHLPQASLPSGDLGLANTLPSRGDLFVFFMLTINPITPWTGK